MYVLNLTHVDTCLSCYVLDHCNGDNEALFGVYVDRSSRYHNVKAALLDAIKADCSEKIPDEITDEMIAACVAEQFSTAHPFKAFDSSLDPAPVTDCETAQAWFRLSWELDTGSLAAFDEDSGGECGEVADTLLQAAVSQGVTTFDGCLRVVNAAMPDEGHTIRCNVAESLFDRLPRMVVQPVQQQQGFYAYPNGEFHEFSFVPTGKDVRKVTKAEFKVGRHEYLRTRLFKLLDPGARVYTVPTAANRYRVLVPTIDDNGNNVICDITRMVAEFCDMRTNKTDGSITRSGCGYNKSFQIVYSLGATLWPNGTPKPHGTRNGEPDVSGGYALKHEAL